MTSLAGIDVRLWQAVIAGGVVALGWIVNGWQNRIEARALKAERLRDAHKALFAEIRTTLAQFEMDGPEFMDGVIDRMVREPDYVPFVPRERHDQIYRTMVGQIDVLPRATIDEIVGYYALINTLTALVEDMRGKTFKEMVQERRIALISDYAATRRRAFRQGELAMAVIAAYADGGTAAARATADRINRQAEAHSALPAVAAED